MCVWGGGITICEHEALRSRSTTCAPCTINHRVFPVSTNALFISPPPPLHGGLSSVFGPRAVWGCDLVKRLKRHRRITRACWAWAGCLRPRSWCWCSTSSRSRAWCPCSTLRPSRSFSRLRPNCPIYAQLPNCPKNYGNGCL